MPLIMTAPFRATIALTSDYYQVARSTAPLSYWRFNESTPTWADEIGNYPMTIVSGTTSNAASLITNDAANLSRFFNINKFAALSVITHSKTKFSVLMWLAASSTSTRRPLALDGQAPYTSIRVNEGGANNIYIGFHTTAGLKSVTGSVTDITQTHCVIATYDEGNQVELFIDGVSQGTTSSPGTAITVTGVVNRIGCDRDNGAIYSGSMDEMKMYQSVINATDAKRMYLVGTGADDNYETLSKSQSPESYWRLSQSSNPFIDEMGNNHATQTNTPSLNQTSLIAADTNDAIRFKEASHEGIFATGFPQFSTTFTMMCWVKPESAFASTDGTLFAAKASAWNESALTLRMNNSGSSTPLARIHTSAVAYAEVNATSTLVIGETYHIAWTYDGVNMRIYVNGKEEGSTATGISVPTHNGAFSIGVADISGLAYPVDATVDEAKVHLRTLSANEVADDYAMGKHGPNTYAYVTHKLNPDAYLKLDETSGTNAEDESGNGNDGTYNASPLLAQTSLLVSGGGTSVTFNGSTQYVGLPTAMVQTGTNPKTISLWAYRSLAVGGTEEVIYFAGSQANGQAIIISYTPTGIRFNAWGGGSFDDEVVYSYAGQNLHLVWVYDGSTKFAYINGVEVVNNTVALNTGSTYNTIARRGDSSRYFAGNVDEVAIYSKALTAGEVKMIYDKGQDSF